mgnify:CR=1 FL=1
MKLIFSLCLLWNFMHPVHVSVMNIDHDAGKGKFIFTIKIYTDDCLTALAHHYQCSAEDTAAIRKYLREYIDRQVTVRINQVVIQEKEHFNIRPMEEENSLLVQYEMTIPAVIKKIEIINQLLCDMFYDQVNLVILTYNGRDYARKLDSHEGVMTLYL